MSMQWAKRSVIRVDGPPTKAALFHRQSSSLRAAIRVLASWFVRSGQRKALRRLAQEGILLDDVGITREQALREAAKPFWRR